MLNDSRLGLTNALTLQWHAGASTIGLEAFQAWCLATLKPTLRFDGAIWGVIGDPHPSEGRRITSVHLHRVTEPVTENLEQVRAREFSGRHPLGAVLNVCLSDPVWEDEGMAEFRDHALRFGLHHSISTRVADAHSTTQQYLLLSRKASTHRFSADDAAAFELLAPHMAQAYATCRKLFLDAHQTGDRRTTGFAVAMIDRAGVIHDQHARFVPMLRREWSDWRGQRLPEPLLDLTARRVGTKWRFLGSQITADFVPVDDLYLVTARPRYMTDSLTKREGEVAQRYAAGSNFREIAESLSLAPATVRSHLRNVFGKLQIRNKSQLAASMRQGSL